MAISPLLWDAEAVIWDAEEVLWSSGGMPAPDCPAELNGTAAPRMLGYLAAYWECSSFMRAILQTEGYELDTFREYIAAMVVIPLTDEMADWSIPMWEANLGIAPDDTWTDPERRRRVAAALTPCQTEAQWAEYLGANLRLDAADITLSLAGNVLTVDIAAVLTTAEEALAERLVSLVLPVHLTATVSGL